MNTETVAGVATPLLAIHGAVDQALWLLRMDNQPDAPARVGVLLRYALAQLDELEGEEDAGALTAAGLQILDEAESTAEAVQALPDDVPYDEVPRQPESLETFHCGALEREVTRGRCLQQAIHRSYDCCSPDCPTALQVARVLGSEEVLRQAGDQGRAA